MLKRTVLVTATVLMGAFMIQCSTNKGFVEHPQSVLITSGSDIGQKYESKGTFAITKTELSFASSGFALANQGNSALFVNPTLSDSIEDLTADTEAFLNQEVLEELRARGGNGIINIRYQVSNVPVLIPFLGPIGVRTYTVTGEIIRR